MNNLMDKLSAEFNKPLHRKLKKEIIMKSKKLPVGTVRKYGASFYKKTANKGWQRVSTKKGQAIYEKQEEKAGISQKAIKFMDKWTFNSNKAILDTSIEKELSKYKPTKPVKLYRVQKVGDKLNRYTSWTYEKKMALAMMGVPVKDFGPRKKDKEVINKVVNPKDILLDFTKLPEKIRKNYLNEVIVKPMKDKRSKSEEVLKFMTSTEQKKAYQIFLKEGSKDTFVGFRRQFNNAIFNPKTGKIIESGGNIIIKKPLRSAKLREKVKQSSIGFKKILKYTKEDIVKKGGKLSQVLKLTINEMLEGFKSKEELKDYMKDMKKDSVFFTMIGYEVNKQTLQDALDIIEINPTLSPFDKKVQIVPKRVPVVKKRRLQTNKNVFDIKYYTPEKIKSYFKKLDRLTIMNELGKKAYKKLIREAIKKKNADKLGILIKDIENWFERDKSRKKLKKAIFYKAKKKASKKKVTVSKKGKIPVKKTITRKGKTFSQTYWMTPEEYEEYKKKKKEKKDGKEKDSRKRKRTISQYGDILRDSKGQIYLEDGLQISRPESYQKPKSQSISESFRRILKKHQQDFVNLAIEKFKEGEKTISCFDGTGSGKTMEELVLAQEYVRKHRDKFSLIVTESKRIIDNAFMKDAEKLGIDIESIEDSVGLRKGKIYITTYSKLKKMKDLYGKIGLSVFDESHNLKNRMSTKSKMGTYLLDGSDNVSLFSATPVDKAEHLHYLCDAYNLNFYQTMKSLGYVLKEYSFGKVWQRNVPAEIVADRMSAMFDDLTKRGLMVKREISLDKVDIALRKITMKASLIGRYHHAEAEMYEAIENASPIRRGLVKAERLLGLRRLLEESKLESTMDLVAKALKEKKQVVLFATRVNQSTVKGDLEPYSLGTLKEVSKRLKEYKIPHATVFESRKGAEDSIKKFQNGDYKVLITTPQSGGTGLSLDDTTGKNPRKVIIMTPPFSSLEFLQMLGRVSRLTTKSRSEVDMLVTDTLVDSWNKGIIANKMLLLGATVKGDYDKLSINDLERLSHLNEVDAKEYLKKIGKESSIGQRSKSVVNTVLLKKEKPVKESEISKKVNECPKHINIGKLSAYKDGDVLKVSFMYSEETVRKIKNITNSIWDKFRREWVVPAQYYERVMEIAKETKPDLKTISKAPDKMTFGNIRAIRSGDVYNIKFPFSYNILNAVKSISTRSWNPIEKHWSVPVELYGEIKEKLGSFVKSIMIALVKAKYIKKIK